MMRTAAGRIPRPWRSAAPAPPAQRPPATFESNITVVSLPVFVTDGKGRSVTGLRAEDFVVEDDGRPVRIVGFREIDAGDAGDEGAPARAAAPEARRQFLLLFDLSFTGVSGLSRARQAATDFVRDGLGPSDLVSVATFSASPRPHAADGVHRRTGPAAARDRDAGPAPSATGRRTRWASRTTSPRSGARSATRSRRTARRSPTRCARSRSATSARRRRSTASASWGCSTPWAAWPAPWTSVQGRKQVVFLSNGFDDDGARRAARGGRRSTRGRR